MTDKSMIVPIGQYNAGLADGLARSRKETERLTAENTELSRKNAVLMAAVEHYADKDNWVFDHLSGGLDRHIHSEKCDYDLYVPTKHGFTVAQAAIEECK